MANLSLRVNPKFNCFLNQEAETVVSNFSKDYRTWRNETGKECIVVYGGEERLRDLFASKISHRLPIGLRAYVLSEDLKNRGERQTYYFDFSEAVEWFNDVSS